MTSPWSVSRAARMLPLLLLLALVFLASGASAYRDSEAAACSRQNSHLSCIMGCFKCADSFGRKSYNMARCCEACSSSKALLVDDGPEFCSPRFFTLGMVDYLKGKEPSRR